MEPTGPSENLATVRRMTAAFNARETEAFLAELDPAAELEPFRAQLEGRRYRGHEGARQMFADFDEDWEYVRLEIDELREAEDRVVGLCRLRARGRASRIDLDIPLGFVWRLRDGQVVHGKSFSEQADALRAAGFE
jgi:ketosteroid isomerase-like protein